MRFSNRNKFKRSAQNGLERHVPDAKEQAETLRLFLLLIVNCIFIISLYFILNKLEFWPIFFIYMGIAAVLVVIYAIYNRGFVYKGATPDMLSDTIPYEEKVAILAEAKQRLRRSRWMLTLIFPFLVAFFVDALYLFLLEDLLESLGISLIATLIL